MSTLSKSKKILSSRNLAKKIAEFADAKKAEDIIVLDMRKIVNFCDYFVISSGTSERQVDAIADHIGKELGDLGMSVHFNKGTKGGRWVVFDVGDVVVHVFHRDVREFYKLEYLWREAKNVKWQKSSSK